MWANTWEGEQQSSGQDDQSGARRYGGLMVAGS